MRRSDLYQISLIFLGIVTTLFLSVFVYREIFPEYRIYQNDYIALEEFRSTYTGQPVPPFSVGIKQIVMEREDKGPPVIDRCISCHVALQLPHFSPTKIARDSSGNIVLDAQGLPSKVSNEEYIWGKLDDKIASLTDAKVMQQLHAQGDSSAIAARIKEAEKYTALKTARAGEHVYDVAKVLAMHPLIGRETRPFEDHPMEEYGCVSCHNGNGRGLTTDKAHGPVFDGEYEIEFTGAAPMFTESDPENDPPFAQVFNHKPGHELLFQTTPLFVGTLIQAKCMQCHQSSEIKEQEGRTSSSSSAGDQKSLVVHTSPLALLTKDYHGGQELFFAQACYACHRISGFTRGGVGPELTHIGTGYPWYIKEKITWPQGTLKSSTMPNYKLDQEEIEKLMTFLLGQTGQTKAISDTDYKIAVQRWEGGRKLPWEQPVTPAEVRDLRYSMTVFATQGCAACHRLEGFTSDVGFAVEKDRKDPVDFEALYKEKEWFERLFPEMIAGSQLVDVIDAHISEIDAHIVDGVRQGSILEEIEQMHPTITEGFYTNFKYAMRAKNHHYAQLALAEKDPLKKNLLAQQLKQWKQRVRRVLLVYIQNYGLGRLIGPRPNWSGVYRTDEWLMEHFLNPSLHVPGSIMPVFPFDESKFYALTYMLDVLGIRNRDAVRAIWENRGFNPELAVEIHCTQCHGELLNGNGPVSEWIYPIPKNLRNAEFLRNLTRERVIKSITHGVKGTPMPPWGELAKDKAFHLPENKSVPVLTADEIGKIADWLFSSLPGGTIIRNSKDVPKWQYTPQEVLKELKDEGSQLESTSTLPSPIPQPITSDDPLDVSSVFDIAASPISEPVKQGYYIKKKYYTEENLRAGQNFFEGNCAACHGKEGDGTGLRAGIMQEAKPRMLNNLDWINTRDDLRLLRSIKYGVPGTAMTPWGDLTNSLQRLQLVLFIRSLSLEAKNRDEIASALYKAFDESQFVIERARITEYAELEKLQKELREIKATQFDLQNKVEIGDAAAVKEALALYERELNLMMRIQPHQELDQNFLQLEQELKSELALYRNLGTALLAQKLADPALDDYVKLIALNQGRYAIVEGKLRLQFDAEKEKQRSLLVEEIVASIDKKIANLKEDQDRLKGQAASAANAKEIAALAAESGAVAKFKLRFLANMEEVVQIRK